MPAWDNLVESLELLHIDAWDPDFSILSPEDQNEFSGQIIVMADIIADSHAYERGDRLTKFLDWKWRPHRVVHPLWWPDSAPEPHRDEILHRYQCRREFLMYRREEFFPLLKEALKTSITWMTVTEAAKRLETYVDNLSLSSAKTRVSRAANDGAFATNGKRRGERRIDRDSFASWCHEKREEDLDKED